MRLTGDSPPTEEELDQIFQSQPMQEPSKEPSTPVSMAGSTLQFGPFDTGVELPEDVSTFLAGVGKSFNDTMVGFQALGAKLGLTNEDIGELSQRILEKRKIDEQLMETGAGFAGSIFGDIAQIAAIPGAGAAAAKLGGGAGRQLATKAAIQGGVFAATRPTTESESALLQGATGAALGAAGQKVGAAVGSKIKKFAQPVTDRISTVAKNMGVELDVAQLTGSKAMGRLKNRLQQLPIPARKQMELMETQQKQFNSAVLQSIGVKGDSASPMLIKRATRRLNKRFNVLSTKGKLDVDDELKSNLMAVADDAAEILTPAQNNVFVRQLDKIKLSKDIIQGKELGVLRSSINNAVTKLNKNPETRPVAEYAKDILSVIDDKVGQTLDDKTKAAWDASRRQWATLSTITDKNVINQAGTDTFNISGPKFYNAIRNVNKRAFARGNLGHVEDVARVGKLLQETVRDSGTAGNIMLDRALTIGGTGGLAGAGSLAAGQDLDQAAKNAIAVGGASFLLTKGAQSVFNSNTFKNIMTEQTALQRGVKKTIDVIEKESQTKLTREARKQLAKILRAGQVEASLAIGNQ